MNIYRATSVDTFDHKTYCVQRIGHVPIPSVIFWIRRWDHILQIMMTNNPGILTYLACHIQENPVAGSKSIYLVSEYATTTLREAKQVLSVADVVKATYQITETLINLKNLGYFHHNINPDTVFIVKNEDGTHSYKLANIGGWMKTHEIEYSKRPEYAHVIPLDYNPSSESSKSDVYSLGITIMEIIGVSIQKLMGHKIKEVDPTYKHDTLFTQGTLIKLLMGTVHPDPEKRISLEDLRDKLKEVIANPSQLDNLEYETFRASLENMPLISCMRYVDLKLKQEDDDPFICQICNNRYDSIQDRRPARLKTCLIHLMCEACAYELLRRSSPNPSPCPFCRKPFKREDIYFDESLCLILKRDTGECIEIKPMNEIWNKPKAPKIRQPREFSIDLSCLRPLFKCCDWVLGISLCLFVHAMAIMIMAIHFGPGIVSSDQIAAGALGIYRNLIALPISDLTWGSDCSSGYDTVDLGTWPGTDSFCYDGGIIEVDYNASECGTIIDGIPATEYTVWKNEKFCAKRIKTVSNSSECPSGYTQCYPGICAYGTDCGITEILFEQSARTDAGWYSEYYNNVYINYRKDVGVLPIAMLDVVQGHPTYCINPYEYGVQINYDAIVSRAEGCSRYGAFPNITQLDSDLSINIFKYQPWETSPISLPQFSTEIGNQTGYLISIPRLGLQNVDACLNFNVQAFLDCSNNLDYSRNITTGFSITIICLLGICPIFLLIELIASGRKGCSITVIIFATIISILTIAPAVITHRVNSDLQSFINGLSSVKDSRCFVDSNAQNVLSDFMNTSSVASRVARIWPIYAIVTSSSLLALLITKIINKHCD